MNSVTHQPTPEFHNRDAQAIGELSHIKFGADPTKGSFDYNGKTYHIQVKIGDKAADIKSPDAWKIIAQKVVLMLNKQELLAKTPIAAAKPQLDQGALINHHSITLVNTKEPKAHTEGEKGTKKDFDELATYIHQIATPPLLKKSAQTSKPIASPDKARAQMNARPDIFPVTLAAPEIKLLKKQLKKLTGKTVTGVNDLKLERSGSGKEYIPIVSVKINGRSENIKGKPISINEFPDAKTYRKWTAQLIRNLEFQPPHKGIARREISKISFASATRIRSHASFREREGRGNGLNQRSVASWTKPNNSNADKVDSSKPKKMDVGTSENVEVAVIVSSAPQQEPATPRKVPNAVASERETPNLVVADEASIAAAIPPTDPQPSAVPKPVLESVPKPAASESVTVAPISNQERSQQIRAISDAAIGGIPNPPANLGVPASASSPNAGVGRDLPAARSATRPSQAQRTADKVERVKSGIPEPSFSLWTLLEAPSRLLGDVGYALFKAHKEKS